MSLTGSNSATQSLADSTLLIKYQTAIDEGVLIADSHQKEALIELQLVYNQLIADSTLLQQNSFSSLFIRPKIKKTTHAGLYLWGGVGRGKTYLLDFFFEQLPIKQKLRLHFHRFMQLIHEELKLLKGEADPLKQVAINLRHKTHLLCLDELHVTDITDAMLLSRLFQLLFDDGLIIVITSNFQPDDLYKNGLQRDRFLPAIKLLKERTNVVEMAGKLDYRRRALQKIERYYIATNNKSDTILEQHFHDLSGVELHQDRTDIIINKRKIPVKMWSAEVVWFSFSDLCDSPRSTSDFSQIATFFRTVLISDIPVMDKDMQDVTRRFINMIDVFYDMHINIVISADAKPEKLYSATRLSFEFKRTISRILEMQSDEYIQN